MCVRRFFNADPHAGNVMVHVNPATRKALPVLLDFGTTSQHPAPPPSPHASGLTHGGGDGGYRAGMTVEVRPRRRVGYCRLVWLASHLDLSGAAHALKDIGGWATARQAGKGSSAQEGDGPPHEEGGELT